MMTLSPLSISPAAQSDSGALGPPPGPKKANKPVRYERELALLDDLSPLSVPRFGTAAAFSPFSAISAPSLAVDTFASPVRSTAAAICEAVPAPAPVPEDGTPLSFTRRPISPCGNVAAASAAAAVNLPSPTLTAPPMLLFSATVVAAPALAVSPVPRLDSGRRSDTPPSAHRQGTDILADILAGVSISSALNPLKLQADSVRPSKKIKKKRSRVNGGSGVVSPTEQQAFMGLQEHPANRLVHQHETVQQCQPSSESKSRLQVGSTGYKSSVQDLEVDSLTREIGRL
jgi:hypothetical protein